VDERLIEINSSMAILMGRVDDIEKHCEEFESIGAFEELHGEVQTIVNSVVADVNKEIQALKTSKAAKDAKIQAYEYNLKSRCAWPPWPIWTMVDSDKYPPLKRECTPTSNLQ